MVFRRNVAVTAPYMHEGSVKTLGEALDNYAGGGRTIPAGPIAGVGARNPNKSEFIKPITLSAQDKSDQPRERKQQANDHMTRKIPQTRK
jgi:cytochrome c peroxidase